MQSSLLNFSFGLIILRLKRPFTCCPGFFPDWVHSLSSLCHLFWRAGRDEAKNWPAHAGPFITQSSLVPGLEGHFHVTRYNPRTQGSVVLVGDTDLLLPGLAPRFPCSRLLDTFIISICFPLCCFYMSSSATFFETSSVKVSYFVLYCFCFQLRMLPRAWNIQDSAHSQGSDP